MKCPHCEYQHGGGWVQDEYQRVERYKGDFYKMPSNAYRNIHYEDRYECKTVYACPSCGKLFIDL